MTPFLFIIVTKGLTEMVRQAKRKNIFEGVKVGGKRIEPRMER